MKTDLVIGYGNELRGDDGVGPRVARAVAAWQWPGLLALDVHQLTPELAEWLATANRAIFIDGAIECSNTTKAEPIGQLRGHAPLGHYSDPRRLLELAQQLYGHCPEAWLVTIPIENVAYGQEISLRAEAGLAEALRLVKSLIKVGACWSIA